MSNQTKLDLIRSLKLGDVVIAGNHIGAIRYLGPLEGNGSCNALNRDIYSLYAGIELTEPNGHMNGTMTINNTTITYFRTAYGDNINRKKERMNKLQNAHHLNGEQEYGKYGLLIPAVSIQKKIDSFALLKKITLIFSKYKKMKKRVHSQANRAQLQSMNSHNTFSSTVNNDIKTNSDLISNNYSSHTPPAATYNVAMISNNLVPLSQGAVVQNTVKLRPHKRQQQWSLTPMPPHTEGTDHKPIALKKMHSFPHTYGNSFVMMDSNAINVNDLPHDEDFASMTPTDSCKKQLSSSLPTPLRVRLHRGYSYDLNRMKRKLVNKKEKEEERQRGCSYHVMQHSEQLPERRNKKMAVKRYHTAIGIKNNKVLKMSAVSTATTSKPSPSPRSVVNEIEIKEDENNDDKEGKEKEKKEEEAVETVNEITSAKSVKSDMTFATSSYQSRAISGHHPSASMYTHGPLNCWTDSNRYLSNKLTSSGGASDKNRDLSSLAIRVHSGHVSTRSASYESPHQQQDSQQLKQLLAELKRNKLNDIFRRKQSKNSSSAMDMVSDKEEEEEEEMKNDDDATATAATVDFNVISSSITSPEEKLAEVENNEDEKQLTQLSDHCTTPIPKEHAQDIVFDADDDKKLQLNNKKRQSLTEKWLRRHNKRKSKIIFKHVINEHHHQQTLSEPMLPKFDLMLHIDSASDDDEKTGSSDGDDDDDDDDRNSLGMDNHLDATENDHTMDITEEDVQLSEKQQDKAYTLWTMAASPISRRSSVNDIIYNKIDHQYKTKHEYLRDITYFNTMHRAQHIVNSHKSATQLTQNNAAADDLDIIKEDIIKHKATLSCDTRCALHESLKIEPYQPSNDQPQSANIVTPPQSALV